MPSVSGALAGGLQSGFDMALREQQAGEQKRQFDVNQQRLQEQFGLQQSAEQRAQTQADITNQQTYLQDLLNEQTGLETKAAGNHEMGVGNSPEAVKRYGELSDLITQTRKGISTKVGAHIQSGKDLMTSLATGDTPLASADPTQFYLGVAATTGDDPKNVVKYPAYIKQIHDGMATNNPELAKQGATGLMQPYLNRGIGEQSPYGGHIIRKELLALDPAQDANNRDHTNRVIPRLRVYVMRTDGTIGYYDAPMTKNGTTAPDDQVVSIDMDKANDWMGNAGVAGTAMQDPQVAQLLEQGAVKGEPIVAQYLNEKNAPAAQTSPVRSPDVQSTDISQGPVAQSLQNAQPMDQQAPAPSGGTGGPVDQGLQDAADVSALAQAPQSAPQPAPKSQAELDLEAAGAAKSRKNTFEQQMDAAIRLSAVNGLPVMDNYANLSKPKTAEEKALLTAKTATEAGKPAVQASQIANNTAGAKLKNEQTKQIELTDNSSPADMSTAAKLYLQGIPPIIRARGAAGQLQANRFYEALDKELSDRKLAPEDVSALRIQIKTSQATEQAFAKGVQGNSVRTFNVGINHADTFYQVAKALGNGQMQIVNKFKNYLKEQFGIEDPTNFDAVKTIFADEVAKAIVGGTSALGDRRTIADAIGRSGSWDQLAGALDKYQKLMVGQLGGLEQQYVAGGGLHDFRETYLEPRSRELLDSIGTQTPPPKGPVSRALNGAAQAPAKTGGVVAAFTSQNALDAAVRAGQVKDGDRIQVGNQTGVWRAQ